MQRAVILGFASCMFGLLPLIEPAKAQQTTAPGCQAVAAINVAGTTTAPVLLNNAVIVGPGQRIVLCGYTVGGGAATATTGVAQLISGFGSACTTSGGITQANLSAQVPSSLEVARQYLAVVLAPGASICVTTQAGTTFASAEINYSLQ